MNPRFGSRSWVKLWVNEWLEGTTRYQMTDGQRAFWVDLLAMAGRSRSGGVVCSGKDGDRWIGYPLVKFQGLLSESIPILETLDLFKSTGKITFQVDGNSPKLYTIFISNWTRYQSEYERQKKSRTKRVTPDYRDKLQAKLQARTRERYTTEGEVEVDKNHCANPAGSHDGVSSPQPLIALEHLDAVRRVWEYYLEKLKKSAKLLTFTPLRKSKGLARLRECLAKTAGDLELAEGLMRVAVDVVAASPWHCGENPQRKRYDSWEKNLFKSQDQLEEWLAKS